MSQGNRRWRPDRALAGGLAGALLLAGPAMAHVAERAFVMLLPTGHYIVGGGLAVALTIAVAMTVSGRRFERLFAEMVLVTRKPWPLERLTQWLGFLLFVALVAIGLFGPRDPLGNLLTLTVWTLWWIGLTLICALAGDLWRRANPFSAPHRLICRLLGRDPEAGSGLPARLGVWPAIPFLFAFGWFELVDPAPDDPARLAWAVLLYWGLTVLAMLIFGARAWLGQGECFSIFFALVARLAPLRARPTLGNRQRLSIALPGARLETGSAPCISEAIFILLALATVTYDGLNETFWWLARLGINPLEFPGRSAIIAQNSLGLVAAWLAAQVIFAVSVALGNRLAGGGPGFVEAFARLARALLPIALAYHFAHYLTVMLVNGQYALAALSDPLGMGRDWLGLGPHYVTTSFLNQRAAVETIWLAQSSAIVIGHVIAVLAAHRIALGLFGDDRRAGLSQLPLGLAMIGYTVLGLWLLASPTA